MQKINIEITFREELLGTASADPKIHEEFIASKAPDAPTTEEEVANLGAEAVVEKSMSVFPKENGRPFLYDYQIKGFFKDACGSLKRVPGTLSEKLKAYKKVIDGTIFVTPRKIIFNGETKVGHCQRPLRAQTLQGERVALANSETIAEGSKLSFTVVLLNPKDEPLLKEWLNYGEFRGLGQWRNSGKGRFTWERQGVGTPQ
jgi:hypothetical protein